MYDDDRSCLDERMNTLVPVIVMNVGFPVCPETV